MNLSNLRTAATVGTEFTPALEPPTLVAARQFVARCMQGLTWRRTGVVVAFCLIFATVLSLDPRTGGAAHSLAAYLMGVTAALTYFLPGFVLVTIAANFAPRNLALRAVVLALTALVGLTVGFYLIPTLREVMIAVHFDAPPHIRSPLALVAMGWLGIAIMLFQERDDAAAGALHESAQYQLDLARRMSEAQLQVLQSQIEPHFLFNSLAHVRRLYQTDPRAGRTMMQHLSRYLSAAQPALRQASIALGHDIDLVVAYLEVQKIRMGPRLEFEIDVPDEAREARVPPMMITTLVENAIKHGLSPLPGGGTVRIVARLHGQILSIRISDTGQGFQTNVGTGVGLANIRARLAMLYGTAAELSLHRNLPRGVMATVVVPVRLARDPTR